jgi:3-hydroxyisobutyrate dehydrogenase-like beta-hydroxyacid dehydrogenase
MSAELPSPTPVASEPAGFVGTGMMGGRMAANLLAAGVHLVITNRSRPTAERLESAGAEWAPRPSAVARKLPGRLIFLMLTDGRTTGRALFGRGGLAGAASTGTLVVNHATIAPEESREFARRLAERGIRYLDAPVGGSIDAAERAELTFYVGGEAEDLDRARPYLDRMGRQIERMGAVGSGSAMKLVNNLMTIGIVGLLAEALAAGESLGLERARTVELLRQGGGASTMLERKREYLATRTYPPQFLVGHARKDLALFERAAKAAGCATALAREVRRLCDEAIVAGHAGDDYSSIAEAARARRVPIRSPPPPTAPPPDPSPPGPG